MQHTKPEEKKHHRTMVDGSHMYKKSQTFDLLRRVNSSPWDFVNRIETSSISLTCLTSENDFGIQIKTFNQEERL